MKRLSAIIIIVTLTSWLSKCLAADVHSTLASIEAVLTHFVAAPSYCMTTHHYGMRLLLAASEHWRDFILR